MCRRKYYACDQIILANGSIIACPKHRMDGWSCCEEVQKGDKVHPTCKTDRHKRCAEQKPSTTILRACKDCSYHRSETWPDNITASDSGADDDVALSEWLKHWDTNVQNFLRDRNGGTAAPISEPSSNAYVTPADFSPRVPDQTQKQPVKAAPDGLSVHPDKPVELEKPRSYAPILPPPHLLGFLSNTESQAAASGSTASLNSLKRPLTRQVALPAGSWSIESDQTAYSSGKASPSASPKVSKNAGKPGPIVSLPIPEEGNFEKKQCEKPGHIHTFLSQRCDTEQPKSIAHGISKPHHSNNVTTEPMNEFGERRVAGHDFYPFVQGTRNTEQYGQVVQPSDGLCHKRRAISIDVPNDMPQTKTRKIQVAEQNPGLQSGQRGHTEPLAASYGSEQSEFNLINPAVARLRQSEGFKVPSAPSTPGPSTLHSNPTAVPSLHVNESGIFDDEVHFKYPVALSSTTQSGPNLVHNTIDARPGQESESKPSVPLFSNDTLPTKMLDSTVSSYPKAPIPSKTRREKAETVYPHQAPSGLRHPHRHSSSVGYINATRPSQKAFHQLRPDGSIRNQPGYGYEYRGYPNANLVALEPTLGPPIDPLLLADRSDPHAQLLGVSRGANREFPANDSRSQPELPQLEAVNDVIRGPAAGSRGVSQRHQTMTDEQLQNVTTGLKFGELRLMQAMATDLPAGPRFTPSYTGNQTAPQQTHQIDVCGLPDSEL